MKRAANKTAVKTEDGKKPFMYSRIYDSSDVNEAAKTAFDEEMDPEELKKQRTRDWLFILLGVPALIGLIYFIVMISTR